MKQTLPLARWLTAPRPDDTPIAWLDESTWTLGDLRHDVAQLICRLQQQPGERWALCFENSYLFIVALLATLHAGKTPVLPGHNRVIQLNEQRELFDGVLSDSELNWQGSLLLVASSPQVATQSFTFAAIAPDAYIELFTSGSTGQPKRVIKPVRLLDREAELLAERLGARLAGSRVVGSVLPQHLYGLTFRVFLPMALGLPLHAAMLWYVEQFVALSHQHRYIFISSPAFLKRLDTQLSPPPVQVLLSAGGELPWQDVQYTASWLRVWPDEIYGSTETGVIAWRYREQEQRRWRPFPGMQFQAEDDALRLFSPLMEEDSGLLLDDILQFSEDGQFHLMGRRGRIVKIEEKRISLQEVEQRLLALDGIHEAAAVPVTRGGRQSIGVLLVLNDEARLQWQNGGGHSQEMAWRRLLRPTLEPVAIPRYWRVIDEMPVNSMNKRVYAQLQELFHEAP
ncbi:TPA: acyl-CoA synthetase [Escherichia fergusonii]|nr:acyl-CoA synthetase [Escherichia fergusonii]